MQGLVSEDEDAASVGCKILEASLRLQTFSLRSCYRLLSE